MCRIPGSFRGRNALLHQYHHHQNDCEHQSRHHLHHHNNTLSLKNARSPLHLTTVPFALSSCQLTHCMCVILPYPNLSVSSLKCPSVCASFPQCPRLRCARTCARTHAHAHTHTHTRVRISSGPFYCSVALGTRIWAV